MSGLLPNSLSRRLAARPVRTPASAASFLIIQQQLRLATLSVALWAAQRRYALSAASAASHEFSSSSLTPSAGPSPSLRHASASSPPTLEAPPSPIEVHQVIARAVQRGRWAHAVRLLLGALHSRCVPLAETYQLVLLAALRGGGWQMGVELTEQVATSPLSTTALYHTAADLLLSQHGLEGQGYGEVLTRTVVEELVPLMLADATRHVVWRPRHREAVLRILAEAQHPQLAAQLFRRWTAATAPPYACAGREAALFMSAFAATGEWRCAEALRVRLPAVTEDLLVDYVRSYTRALKSNTDATSSGGSGAAQLVPWEAAMDVAARHPGHSALTAAAAQLRHVAQLAAAPADVLRWWWAPETTAHAKLTELRRRASASPDGVARLLGQCHVTTAGVVELLEALRAAGVLGGGSCDVAMHERTWLDVALALARHCPAALVSENGCADGLVQLLPDPQRRVLRTNGTAGSADPSSARYLSAAEGGDDLSLWRYVISAMLAEPPKPNNDGEASRRIVALAATLHYVVNAQEKAALSTANSPSSASGEVALAAAVKDVCEGWTQQLQPSRDTLTQCKEAVAVYLRTVGLHARVPTFAQCVQAVLTDASGTAAAGVVDTAALALLQPLAQLRAADELCEVMCAALTDAAPLLVTPHAAYLVVVYTAALLRGGTAVATARPTLRRVEAAVTAAPQADTLLLLCAQLQWCWAGSMEALRVSGVPILLRRQCWDVLSRLLHRCPAPLTAQEERAVVMTTHGQQLTRLADAVGSSDVDEAWARWEGMAGHDGVTSDAISLSIPLPLHADLVFLLVRHHRAAEACAVLTVPPAGAATAASWPQRSLRVCRHVLRSPAADVALSDLWAVADIASGDDEGRAEVARREAATGLAMHAAAALSLLQRDTDAFRLLREAVEFVEGYDANFFHAPQRLPAPHDGEVQEGTDVFADDTLPSLALSKTDAQLSESLALFVPCTMPAVVCAAVLQALDSSAASKSDESDFADVLHVGRQVFLLTSHTPQSLDAWSAVVPQLHSAATSLASTGLKATTEATSFVSFLSRSLLRRAAAVQVAAPHAVVQRVVDTITASGARTLPNATSLESASDLLDTVRQSLVTARNGSLSSGGGPPAAVEATASRVAHFLASQGRYAEALAWVNDFNLWAATGDARIASTELWRWIQASCTAAQQLTETRAALCQRRADAVTDVQSSVEKRTTPGGTNSLDMLEALMECGAWQEAVSCYLEVVLEPPALPRRTTNNAMADFAHVSDAAMEAVVRRDSFLAAGVLNALLCVVAAHAPWRTCMQTWMLLCACLPLLPWSTVAPALRPALLRLLRAMTPQGATVDEVGAVVAWVIAQLDPPSSTVTPLLRCFADAIDAAPAWTRADGELCAARLRQLRGLLSERRVREAAAAIAEAEATLALAPARLSASSSTPSFFSSGDGVSASREAWLLPGRPQLSSDEVDALAALAPLLLVATTPQLDILARRHLNGRFQSYELKALLWQYRDELHQRIDGATAAEGDAALIDFLAHNPTLHACAAAAFAGDGTAASDAAAARWLSSTVFDGLLPPHLSVLLWDACRAPAAALAACRWTPVVEAELCEQILLQRGRTPARLRTAPQLSRHAIAHYWSVFHRVLLPELHFGPLELCCLAAYTPALTQLRTQHSNGAEDGYGNALLELAGEVHRAHFSASQMPAEDTLAYLRRPRSPAAIAAVLSTAHKKLKVLHAQLYSSGEADTAKEMQRHALPERLRRHFTSSAAALPSLATLPARLQPATIAAAVRRLGSATDETPPAAATSTPAITPCPASTDVARFLAAAQRRLPTQLVRSWACWVLTACVASQKPIPAAASLLLVEWVKAALHAPERTMPGPAASSEEAGGWPATAVRAEDAVVRWQAVAQAGQQEGQQRLCRELCSLWELLSEAEAWPLMSVGHRAALEKMVWPTPVQVKSLPTKKRGSGGPSGGRKETKVSETDP